MNSSPESDPLDELFRENDDCVDDSGFTARVIDELPRRRHAWVTPAILLGAAVIGSVLAIFWVPWRNLPALDSTDLLSAGAHALLPWFFALAVIGSLIWSAAAAGLRRN